MNTLHLPLDVGTYSNIVHNAAQYLPNMLKGTCSYTNNSLAHTQIQPEHGPMFNPHRSQSALQ